MTAPASVADVLTRAADIIEQHGWCQGDYTDDTGRVCIAQALLSAGSSMAEIDAAGVRVEQHLRLDGVDIVDWNDAPGRTKDDVVTALRAAALSG